MPGTLSGHKNVGRRRHKSQGPEDHLLVVLMTGKRNREVNS